MWLTDYLTKNSLTKAQPNIGSVTHSDTDSIAVDAALEHRQVMVVAPYGVAYNPEKNDKSVILPVEDSCVCIGVIPQKKQLNEGELMLYSSGGAYILLKNNGEVEINGKVFEK